MIKSIVILLVIASLANALWIHVTQEKMQEFHARLERLEKETK